MERTWRIMITLHPAVNLFLHLFTHWLTHLTYSFYPLSLHICIHRLYHIRREKGAVREGIWFFSSCWLIFLAYNIVQVTNKADDYATASNTGFSLHGFPPSLGFFSPLLSFLSSSEDSSSLIESCPWSNCSLTVTFTSTDNSQHKWESVVQNLYAIFFQWQILIV